MCRQIRTGRRSECHSRLKLLQPRRRSRWPTRDASRSGSPGRQGDPEHGDPEERGNDQVRRRCPDRIAQGSSQGIQTTLQHDEQDRGCRQLTRGFGCAASPGERGRSCRRKRTQECGGPVAEMDDRLSVGASSTPRAARPGGASKRAGRASGRTENQENQSGSRAKRATMTNGRSAEASGRGPVLPASAACLAPRQRRRG